MGWHKTVLVVAYLTVSSGCFCRGVCTKRESELHCPTDIRKTHYWCFGEDAIMHCPCGPKEELYGYERTDWREWPADECCNGNCCVPVAPNSPGQPEQLPEQTNAQAPASAATNPFENDLPAAQPARPSPPGHSVPMPPAAARPMTQHAGLIEPSQHTRRTNPGAVVSPPNLEPSTIRQEQSINGPLQVIPPNRPVTAPQLPPKQINQIQTQRPLLEEELSPEERDRRRQALLQMLKSHDN